MHGKIFKAHQNIGLNWLTRYVLFELNFQGPRSVLESGGAKSSIKPPRKMFNFLLP